VLQRQNQAEFFQPFSQTNRSKYIYIKNAFHLGILKNNLEEELEEYIEGML